MTMRLAGKHAIVTGAAFYLADEDNRNVYGQVNTVDGGFASAGIIFDPT